MCVGVYIGTFGCCNCKGRNLSSITGINWLWVAYSGVGAEDVQQTRCYLDDDAGEGTNEALARSALTEVATGLGCVVFVDENILSACGANTRPCTGGKERIGERDLGCDSYHFHFSFFDKKKKQKGKNISFGILVLFPANTRT
jgi:hypothetical protein